MHRQRLVAGLLLPLALLVGCGGDPDEASGPDEASSSEAASVDTEAPDEAPDEASDVCELLPADAASQVAGFAVTAQEGPFDLCEYSQDDPRATSFALGAQLEAELGGGVQAYLDGITAGLTVEDESTPDIGERARIATGEVSGFSQTAGAALVGGVLFTVNLTPGADLDAAGELALAEKLLRALVDAD